MDAARNQPEDLFASLNIRLRKFGKKYVGCCPVHSGDSGDSLNFYPDGVKGKAFWLCLSNHCERTFGGSLLGFVQGVLSNQKNGWEGPADTKLKVSGQRAIDFLCEFTGMTWDDIKADLSIADTNRFVNGIEYFTMGKESKKGICSRERLQTLLEIPANYYIDRNYSTDIIQRYDIGYCNKPASDLYGRVVVPFLSDDGNYVIGCIGRSIHEECPQCKMHHHESVECFNPNSRAVDYCKWKTSNRFNDKHHLFNYWNAGKHIIKCNRTIIVVEGCGDVLRLEEAGINNSVAINGSDLTEPQMIAIECSGATTILCLTDNDKAGNQAFNNMVSRCCFAVTIRVNEFSAKDVGELNVDDPLFDYLRIVCNPSVGRFKNNKFVHYAKG